MANIGHFNGAQSVLSNVDQIGFRAINFRQKTQTIATTTLSGRTVRSSVATTLWSATLDFPALTHKEFRQIQGFVALARGSLNDFFIQFPNISSRTAGGVLTDLQVLDSASAGASSVKAYSTTDSAGGIGADTPSIRTPVGTILNMGDIIKFSNHSKVYMCTTDVTPDSGGDFEINFEPPLVSAVTGYQTAINDSVGTTDVVQFDNVVFKMIFASDTADYRYNVDGTVNFRIDVQEVI